MKPNRNWAEDFSAVRFYLLIFWIGFSVARKYEWGRWVFWVVFGLYFGSFVVHAVAWWFLVERPSRREKPDERE